MLNPKRWLAVSLISLPSLFSLAQLPVDKLHKWAGNNPIEKLYLHFDRDEYVAGQTLWFKAYLYSEFQVNDKSTTLFVELFSPLSGIISRKTFPVIRAVTQGQFDLPDTLSSGNYIIRAYTATMLNQGVDFIYKRGFSVTGKKSNEPPASGAKKIRMEFFPEGGNFVAGQSNTIAFKATTDNGLPVAVNGFLRNEKGETLSEFSSYHDGMGMIEIDAKEKENYHVVLSRDPGAEKYYLPAMINKGIVFRIMNGGDGIHFEIFQQKGDPVFNASYMIGQMQHNVVFKQPFKEGSATLNGIIKTDNLLSGILHITVFNKDGMPLAERLSFVNNKEYLLQGDLKTDTVNFSSRGRNHYTVSLKDTVVGNFSVSITDPAYNSSARQQENIVSRFLLMSDLKGYIHQPAYYFSSDNDSVKYALDLVMMTNGWSRFKWDQLLKDSLTTGKFKDPGFINLSGRVSLEGTKKPFADREMLLFIVTADSSRNIQMIKTDANGYYQADSLLFFGKANILFSDIRGKQSKFVDIKPGADSLNRSYGLPGIDKAEWLSYKIKESRENTALSQKLADEFNVLMRSSGEVLSEIVLKSKKKTALQELEDKYTTGAFSGDTRKTFDLVNSDETAAYTNIFDYLTARVPGLNIGKTEAGDYYVYYRQTATVSAMGNQGMDIFLDEVLTDASTVAFIPPAQIAMVKVYSNFVGSTGGGSGGALAIYMKKGADLFNSLPAAGEMIVYNGFSVIKEFYAPNYSVAGKEIKPDHRMTLHWDADIAVSGINPKFPVVFYNNDRTRSFKIVVEGMTVDGKMLMIEKLVTAKPF